MGSAPGDCIHIDCEEGRGPSCGNVVACDNIVVGGNGRLTNLRECAPMA